MYVDRGCLIVQASAEGSAESIAQLRGELLVALGRGDCHGVVLDLGRVRVLGSADYAMLQATVLAIRVAGAQPIVVGIGPGVAAALVELDLDVDGLPTARSVEVAVAGIANAPDA